MRRKLTVWLFVIIFVLAGMTGCGSKSESSKRETESKEESKSGIIENPINEKDDEKYANGGKDDNIYTDDNIQSDISDWEEYYGLGYSLKLSPEWKEIEYEGMELSFVHSSTAADGTVENINTVTQDISEYDLDLESYLDLSLQQYEEMGEVKDIYRTIEFY